jgi:hypothetical protein
MLWMTRIGFDIADAMHRFVYEALVPLVKSDGLWDSAIDRIQRVAGGATWVCAVNPPTDREP